MHRPFRLKRPIGPDSNMDLDDVLNTKRALKDLDFMSVPKYGLTPYPDQPMIDGIKSFQRKNKLRVDGVMKPDGPTLKSLNQTLAERQPPSRLPNSLSKVPLPAQRGLLNTVLKPSNPLARISARFDSASRLRAAKQSLPEPNRLAALSAADQSPPSQPATKPSTTKPKDEKQVAAAAAAIPFIGEIPGILGAIAGMLGLTLPLRGDVPKDNERERKCNEQFASDSEICRQVKDKNGAQAAQRCWASSMERYGNCLAGRPVPDLDRGVD